MDFEFDVKTVELRDKLLAFMDAYIYPNESAFEEQVATGPGGRRHRSWRS